MIVLLAPMAALANSGDKCEQKSEGHQKADCLLENDYTGEYFEYVKSHYEEIKNEEDAHNPALGFRFLEAVVKHEATQYTELATEIYFWGLQADEVEPYKEVIEREISYMSTLFNSDEEEEFEKLLEKNDPAVYDKIRGFWKNRDVVMSSSSNERLLEHWERIFHSKENFTENDTTVYGTDERANIYVRLGEPNEIRNGRFGTSQSEVRAKLYDLQEKGHLSQNPTAMFQMQQEILTSVIPAEYELWHYDNLADYSSERVFFLFGRRGGTGPYGLRNSVEDFIPSETFSRALGNRSTGDDIRIANFLQFMYYNDLSTFNIFFGNQLQEYDRAWHNAIRRDRINSGHLRNSISRQRARLATEKVYDTAPTDTSVYERQLQNYELDLKEYRFLDDEGNPELFYIITSDPREFYDEYGYMINNQGERFNERDYDMHIKQGVSHFGEDNTRLGVNMYQLPKIYQSDKGENHDPFTSHSIALADNEESYAIAFSELYFGEQGDEDYPDSWSLIGMEKNNARPIPTLDYEKGDLVLSDIVLGSPGRDTVAVRDEHIGILENGYKLEEGEDLQVYFEGYYFEESDSDYIPYEVEYRIESSGRSWWPFSSSSEQSLTWEAGTDSWRDKQYFEVEPADVDPGKYELHITVTETDSGREASRSVEFEIMELSEDS